MFFFFFFQAEDGIRDKLVTGVQTCALPIGYAAGPKDLITAMTTVQSQSTSNPTSIAQKAAVAALNQGEAFIKEMVAEFDQWRRVMGGRLNKIPGGTCAKANGGV